MNKLLQHIIDAGDVSHKVLIQYNNGIPFIKKPLVKAQNGLENTSVQALNQPDAIELNVQPTEEQSWAWRTTSGQVPVMPAETKQAPSAPKSSYRGVSVVDYLRSRGMDFSKAARKDLAKELGVDNYNYSASKNLELLSKLAQEEEDTSYFENIQRASIAARENEMRAAAAAAERKRLAAVQPKIRYERNTDAPVLTQPKPKPAPQVSNIQNFPYLAAPKQTSTGMPPMFDARKFLYPGAAPVNTPAPSRAKAAPATKPAPAKPAVQPSSAVQQPSADFRNMMFDPNRFLRPQPTLGPVYNPPQRSEVPEEVEEQTDDRNIFEKAWDWFSDGVNNNPYLKNFTPSYGTSGLRAEGNPFVDAGKKAGKATSALVNTASDYYDKAQNWYKRNYEQELQDERKSTGIKPMQLKYDPIYVTGDTLRDNKRRYHIPELIDLDYVRFGTRNRGDFREIETEGAPITVFEPFQSSGKYFAKSKDPANATYIGIDNTGKVKVGGRDQFLDQEYQISKTYSNKVVDFIKNPDGSIARKTAPTKASRRGDVDVPKVQVLGDDGKLTEGSLNLLLPKTGKGEDAFDIVTGGRYIFQTPDGKTKLVSGSLKMIADEFYRMKKNNPYVNVVTLDNGSYSRGIRTYDKKLTAQDLRAYDNQNTAGANMAYILPGPKKTRYDSKFFDFEQEATRRLRSKFPGRDVAVRFQNTGLYDESGGRDVKSQVEIQRKGNSQTPVSLHNFGAAKDYVLYVDGKPIDADNEKKLYKDVLWGAADKIGLYHLEDWDPTHVSLAKEGQKTAFDELYAKYPDIFANPNFAKSLEFINQNRNNPLYAEYFELLNNIQPFTGKPRVTEVMKKNSSKKEFGGPMFSMEAGGSFLPKYQGDKAGSTVDFSRYYNPIPRSTGDIASLPGVRIQVPLSNKELQDNRKAVEQRKAAEAAKIVADRKARIKASEEARKRPFSAQQLADETQAIGDKFRLFPEDANSFIDDYLNPMVFIGDLASNLGRVPLNIQQGNYGRALWDVAAPALVGAGEAIAAPYVNRALSSANTKIAQKFNFDVADEFKKAGRWIADETNMAIQRNARRLKPGYVKRKNALIEEGNRWTRDWYSDPIIQERYNNWVNQPSMVLDPKQALDMYKVASSIPNTLDPSLSEKIQGTIARNNMANFLATGKGGTRGVTTRSPFNESSTIGRFSPFKNDVLVDVLHPSLGSSQGPVKFSTPNVAVHENIHYLTRGNEGLTSNAQKFLQTPFRVDPVTNLPSKVNVNSPNVNVDYDKYLINPTEVHARIGEIRRQFGLKPEQTVDYPMINRIMDEGLKGNTSVDKRWFELVDDKSALKWLFNNAPAAVPGVAGAALLEKKKKGGSIVDPYGQWTNPGKRTIVPTPDGRITMKGVSYPVYGQDETGFGQMMYPEQEYQFPGQIVDETPMMQPGGIVSTYDGIPNPNVRAEELIKMHNTKARLAKKFIDPVKNKAEVFIEEWMKSPMYAQMLYGNNPEDVAWDVDGGRKSNFDAFKKRGSWQYGDLDEDKSFLEKLSSTTLGYFRPSTKEISLNKNLQDLEQRLKTAVHEVSHASDSTPRGTWISIDDVNKMKEYKKDYYNNLGKLDKFMYNLDSDFKDYIANPTETRARLNTIRFIGKEKGVYDPFTQKIDRRKLNQINDSSLDQLRMIYSDDQILDMLNSISKARSSLGLPMAKGGGQHGGLDRWFAEKWVDVKTGKPCGRQEGESRAYPACRPSRRVSSQTPKTSSEMSPAEKAKFKRTKTSSERIPYNHKRK